MPTYTAPGVYVEEVPSGVRPIQAAGTSTAAFFGEAERGPVDSVTNIFNFTDFQTVYGGFLAGGRYLAHAVYHFFNNGGAACYVGFVGWHLGFTRSGWRRANRSRGSCGTGPYASVPL